MPKISKHGLLRRVVEGVWDGGWKVVIVRALHPFLLRIWREDESYLVRAYVWNLTHGGGAERPRDEYRIQVTGIDRNLGFLGETVDEVLILGWREGVRLFAAFDIRRHTGSLGASPSMQLREDALRRAAVRGFATHRKATGEMVVVFRPEFLPTYVRCLEQLHDLGRSETDVAALESTIEEAGGGEIGPFEDMLGERRTVVREVAKKVRDTSFRDRVLAAYGNRCAFCGLQLKLVDAAHLVPVAESGTDAIENGITLCALHHRSFDRALVTVTEEYRIILNPSRLEELEALDLDSGMGWFEERLRDSIVVPPARADRPHPALIRRANEIRGWSL